MTTRRPTFRLALALTLTAALASCRGGGGTGDEPGIGDRVRADQLVAEGKDQFERKEYDRAARSLQGALAARPDDPDVLTLLGWSLFKAGRPREAIVPFERLVQLREQPAGGGMVAAVLDSLKGLAFERDRGDPRSGLGWCHYNLGNPQTAAEAFEAVLSDDTDNVDSRCGLGFSRLALGQYDEAIRHLHEALRYEQRIDYAPFARCQLAWCHFYKGAPVGDFAAAEAEFQAVVRDDPGHAVANQGLGLIRHRQGRAREARECLERSLATSPAQDGVHELVGWLCYWDGDVDAALGHFRQATSLAPTRAWALSGLGWCLLRKGQHYHARGRFEKALAAAYGQPDALAGLAELARLRDTRLAAAWERYYADDFAAAQEAFALVRRDFGGDLPTLCGLCWCLLRQERYDEAEQELQRAEAIAPLDPSVVQARGRLDTWKYVHFNAAYAHWEAGRHEEAVEGFRRAIDDTVRRLGWVARWNAQRYMAWSLLRLGRQDEAEAAFTMILDGYPPEREPAVGLGWIRADALLGVARSQAERGDDAAALETLKFALERYPELVEGWLDLGRVHRRSGHADEALAAFRRAAALAPARPEPYLGAAMVHCDGAAYEEARAELATALAIAPTLSVDDAEVARALKEQPLLRDLHLDAGWAWYHRMDHAAARDAFQRAQDVLGAADVRPRTGLGYALYGLGEWEEAARHLEAAMADPAASKPVQEWVVVPGAWGRFAIWGDARSTLAWCRLRQGREEDAERLFTQVIEEHADWVDARCGRGWCRLAREELDAAEEDFREAGRLAPPPYGYPDAASGLAAVGTARFRDLEAAWALHREGHHEEAARAFEEQIDESAAGPLPEGERWRLVSGLGWSRLDAGDLDGAEQAFKELLDREGPARDDGRRGLGFVSYRKGLNTEAARRLSELLTATPLDAEAWAVLGWCRQRDGDHAGAVEAFDRSLAIQPHGASALQGMGWARHARGEYEQARAALEAALGLDARATLDSRLERAIAEREGWWDLYVAAGWGHHHAGRSREAMEVFRKAAERPTRDHQAYLGLGLAAFAAKDYSASASAMEKYLALRKVAQPTEGEAVAWDEVSTALSTVGWASLRLGDLERARQRFRELLDRHKGNDVYADPHDGLGWCLLGLDRKEEARAAFQRALELAPGYAHALEGMKGLEEG